MHNESYRNALQVRVHRIGRSSTPIPSMLEAGPDSQPSVEAGNTHAPVEAPDFLAPDDDSILDLHANDEMDEPAPEETIRVGPIPGHQTTIIGSNAPECRSANDMQTSSASRRTPEAATTSSASRRTPEAATNRSASRSTPEASTLRSASSNTPEAASSASRRAPEAVQTRSPRSNPSEKARPSPSSQDAPETRKLGSGRNYAPEAARHHPTQGYRPNTVTPRATRPEHARNPSGNSQNSGKGPYPQTSGRGGRRRRVTKLAE